MSSCCRRFLILKEGDGQEEEEAEDYVTTETNFKRGIRARNNYSPLSCHSNLQGLRNGMDLILIL